jgi:hypothetical protein
MKLMRTAGISSKIKNHLGLPTDPYHELPKFDDPFAEWDAADNAAIAVAHAPLPHPHRRTCASTRSHRDPPGGQEIFDEDVPQDYHEHHDSDEDEDTSEEDADDDDE